MTEAPVRNPAKLSDIPCELLRQRVALRINDIVDCILAERGEPHGIQEPRPFHYGSRLRGLFGNAVMNRLYGDEHFYDAKIPPAISENMVEASNELADDILAQNPAIRLIPVP